MESAQSPGFVSLSSDLRQAFLRPTAQSLSGSGAIQFEFIAELNSDSAYASSHLGHQPSILSEDLSMIFSCESLQLLDRQLGHTLPLVKFFASEFCATFVPPKRLAAGGR